MKSVTVSAPGKLILLGDYAVVHNHPCLVAAIDQRFTLSARLLDKPELRLNAPKLDLSNYQKPLEQLTIGIVPKAAEYIEYAVSEFIKRYPQKTGVQIDTAAAQMDAKFGFGTSAAATVATIKALAVLFDRDLDNRTIFDISYQTVQALKGVGSGFDMATATYGGFLYFVTGGKAIEPLTIKPFNLIVAYSGNKADTPSLIRAMNDQIKVYPQVIHGFFDVSEQIVEQARQDLQEGNMASLGKLLNMHQGLLAALGVSTPQLDKICQVALTAGAYGAKLSGAGGGDCAIVLAASDKTDTVIDVLNKAGFETMLLSAGSEGVRVEASS